tara:strand:+ start:445 stop:2073 length:1629 start_codon:yes stop_codon:yes gene_type:complete
MKYFYIALFFITSIMFSDIDKNLIAKDKPIWTDAVVVLNHQFRLVEGLGKVKSYLCLFRASDYVDDNNNGLFVNLEHEGNPIGHKVMVDALSCERAQYHTPWVYRAQQSSSDDPLVIDMFNLSETPTGSLDTRARLIQEENADAANPYGILTLDYGLVSKLSDPPDPSTTAYPLYAATYESTRLEDNTIQFKSAVYLDSVVSTGAPATFFTEFYSSTIIHTPNSGGEGTVTSRMFQNLDNQGNPRIGFIYPGGTPNVIVTNNFAYDENYILYKEILGINGATSDERCIDKSTSATWSYVVDWGYGIYDSAGDRINFNAPVTAPYTDPGTGVAATLLISGGNIQIDINTDGIPDFTCKKIEDGSHLDGNNPCPPELAQAFFGYWTIAGEKFENFPLFDIPDGTVIQASDGSEYYIRVLRPRLVRSEVPMSNCASLTIPLSKDTPDHTFFNFHDLTIPRSGAILVNDLDAANDLFSNGVSYPKDGDFDNDGVLNYLDAFPTDPLKSIDDDYDGLEDSFEDNDILQFQINYDKQLTIPMLQNHIK